MPLESEGENKQETTTAGKPDGQDSDKKSTPPVISFASRADFDKEVERIIGERLERAERKKEREVADAKEKLEAESLEKNKEFEELAEKRAKQIEELKAKLVAADGQDEKLKKYEGVLTKILAEKRQGVPEYLVTLLDEFDPIRQLEYITANADKLKVIPPEEQQTKPVPETPKPDGSAALTDAQRKEQSQAYAATLQRRI